MRLKKQVSGIVSKTCINNLIYKDYVKKISRSSNIEELNIQYKEFDRISTNIKKMQFIEKIRYFVVMIKFLNSFTEPKKN